MSPGRTTLLTKKSKPKFKVISCPRISSRYTSARTSDMIVWLRPSTSNQNSYQLAFSSMTCTMYTSNHSRCPAKSESHPFSCFCHSDIVLCKKKTATRIASSTRCTLSMHQEYPRFMQTQTQQEVDPVRSVGIQLTVVLAVRVQWRSGCYFFASDSRALRDVTATATRTCTGFMQLLPKSQPEKARTQAIHVKLR